MDTCLFLSKNLLFSYRSFKYRGLSGMQKTKYSFDITTEDHNNRLAMGETPFYTKHIRHGLQDYAGRLFNSGCPSGKLYISNENMEIYKENCNQFHPDPLKETIEYPGTIHTMEVQPLFNLIDTDCIIYVPEGSWIFESMASHWDLFQKLIIQLEQSAHLSEL